jgi:hypothetical protein
VVRGESAGPHVGSDLQPAFRCRLSLDLFFHLFPFVLSFVCLGPRGPSLGSGSRGAKSYAVFASFVLIRRRIELALATGPGKV